MTSHEKVIMTGVTAHVPCLGTQDLNTENWQFLTEREREIQLLSKNWRRLKYFPILTEFFDISCYTILSGCSPCRKPPFNLNTICGSSIRNKLTSPISPISTSISPCSWYEQWHQHYKFFKHFLEKIIFYNIISQDRDLLELSIHHFLGVVLIIH